MIIKNKAKAYHNAVSAYNEGVIKKMVHNAYIQHNPKVPSGRAAFLSMIPKLKHYGSKIENIRMLGDGDHVVMHHKWTNAIPFGFEQTAAFHIIRFDSEGLIAEHWNVMTGLGPLNPSNRSLIDGETSLFDMGLTATNKALIRALFTVFTQKSADQIIARIPFYYDSDFNQHHPKLADGTQHLIEAIEHGLYWPRYIKQHALFGEGNFILSISEGVLSEKNIAIYDLYNIKNNKIIEQWNITQEIPTENLANTNTMFNFK